MAVTYNRGLLGRLPWGRVPGQLPSLAPRDGCRAAPRDHVCLFHAPDTRRSLQEIQALVELALSPEHGDDFDLAVRLHDAFERYDCSYSRACGRSLRE